MIENASLRCTAELGLRIAGEGGATAAAAPIAASAPRAAVRRAAQVLTEAAPPPTARRVPWLIAIGKGEIVRPRVGYAAPAPARLAKDAGAEDKAVVTSPLDFLRDSRLTAEEKLVLLLAQQQKDVEGEIEGVLRKAEAKSAQKQKSSGGLGKLKVLDLVKTAVPALGIVEKVFGDGALTKAVAQLGGPVLAAAATAFGAPELAPLALSAGADALGAALDATLPLGSAPAESKSVNAPNAGTGSSTALDPVETQRLTLLVNRQQQWASTVSNLLHTLHQTRMNVVQNLR